MSQRVHVTREDLVSRISSGEIDTVLMVFPDLQGRLVGKRTTGRFFLEHVADDGTENCDYLIACDMDNNPVPGYRFASYEQGYGDMLARAEQDTPGGRAAYRPEGLPASFGLQPDGLYRLSEDQAQEILQMRLQRLTGLEQDKIIGEYKDVMAQIADLLDILARFVHLEVKDKVVAGAKDRAQRDRLQR